MKKNVLALISASMVLYSISCKIGNVSDPEKTTPPPVTRPPGTPALLTATAVSPSIIDIDWVDTSHVITTGFGVERQAIPNTIWEVLDSTPATVTKYRDNSVLCANTYKYRVYAYNKVGRSFFSNTSGASTPFDSVIVQNSGVVQDLFGVAFYDNHTGLVVGNRGVIIRTTDGGSIWDTLQSGTTMNLRSVSFSTGLTVLVVGSGGTILRTDDLGNNWSSQNSGISSELRSVAFVDANTWVAVGLGGTILRSTNGGGIWLKMTSGVSVNLWAVSFINSSSGIASGATGTILWTTDGGANWVKLNSETNNSLYSVSLSDPITATAVGDFGTIIRTTDGGNSWASLASGVSTGLYAVSFVDANNGVAAGSTAGILHTNDGGLTWMKEPFTMQNKIQGIFSQTGHDVTIVGVFGMIVRTISCVGG